MNDESIEQELPNDDILTEILEAELPEAHNTAETPETSAISAEEELEQLKDAHLRLMAEYENYRKRTLKEKVDLIQNGGEKVIVGLLPVIDDFQRALDTIENANDLAAIQEGVNLIYQKFLAFLQQNGVKAIDAIGQAFNADLYEAVATLPAPAEEQRDTVIDSVQTGYTLNDKVIRHAKVVVAN
ncbi:MAG: Protein GrpE [Candidatus Ordinivivax streblomastigis]|uniref:Protein GrpE n=1 Tax=Candidatus Ordinivivax streblomastigis TaxID=2540710 RepID=A0A5M8P3I6_9BACT|nr:MAG: Protein GrpE [Candidatus Ordinivivax streblomastigis]